jgi:hypothetical protein
MQFQELFENFFERHPHFSGNLLEERGDFHFEEMAGDIEYW